MSSKTIESTRKWLEQHGIEEVEGVVPDMAGVARGKFVPAEKFCKQEGMRLPESIFIQTVTGEYVQEPVISAADPDMVARPDPETLCRIDTLIHESGAGQVEINFEHGDPLALADQVFLFKRTVRETAMRHNVYATFMAKPMANEPGSAMHIHQSVVETDSGNNIFSDQDGSDSTLLHAFIAGQQKYGPESILMAAPTICRSRCRAISSPRWTACRPVSVCSPSSGGEFVDVYCKLKQQEHETFVQVISAWEREFLLLNV